MNKKLRSPSAYLLEHPSNPFSTVVTLLEQAGFAVQKHEDVASLIGSWLDDPTRTPAAILAPATQGGLMLARLRLENVALPRSALVLLDDQRQVSTAIQAIRLQASDYILTEAPAVEIKLRIDRLFHKLSESDTVPTTDTDDLEIRELDEAIAVGHSISWDESLNAVRRGDTWISLSPIEWRLFYTLVNRRGSVVPLEDLVLKGLQRTNDTDADVPLLRLHISRLRSKLNENFGHELNVVTLRGRGYMLV
jgi:two-component system, OmpR family, response regulator RegX3